MDTIPVDIECTELQEKEQAWRKERQEFRDQINQLKSDLQMKQNEIDRANRVEKENQRALDVSRAEIEMLRNQQSGFDGERTFLMGEIENLRRENNDMRGYIRGIEFALSVMNQQNRE